MAPAYGHGYAHERSYRAPTRWDRDGDGVPNRDDRVYNPRWDRDGDGVPNRYDRHDNSRQGAVRRAAGARADGVRRDDGAYSGAPDGSGRARGGFARRNSAPFHKVGVPSCTWNAVPNEWPLLGDATVSTYHHSPITRVASASTSR